MPLLLRNHRIHTPLCPRIRQQALKHQYVCSADKARMTQMELITWPEHVVQHQLPSQVDVAPFIRRGGEVVKDRRAIIWEVVVRRRAVIGVFDDPLGCRAYQGRGIVSRVTVAVARFEFDGDGMEVDMMSG